MIRVLKSRLKVGKASFYFTSGLHGWMSYWYSLHPYGCEVSDDLIDVRALPEKYQVAPAEVRLGGNPSTWTDAMAGAIISQERGNHAQIFAAAVSDGYDFQAHIAHWQAVWKAEAEERQRNAALSDPLSDLPF